MVALEGKVSRGLRDGAKYDTWCLYRIKEGLIKKRNWSPRTSSVTEESIGEKELFLRKKNGYRGG